MIGSEWQEATHTLPVTNPYSQEVLAEVSLAGTAEIDGAIALAVKAFERTRVLPTYLRSRICLQIAQGIENRKEEFAETISKESGKPLLYSRAEVARSISTFHIAAEEASRIHGEVLPLDITESAKGKTGLVRRFPIGPVSGISPFNFPLNLAAHKVAPALAVGCPFVLKPASATPVGALLIGEVLAECDLPEGAFSILPCAVSDAEPLVIDERLKLLSFTGSHGVGWQLKAAAGKKGVRLELGGNAACVVDEDADLEDAVARLVIGAFYQSGQSCIGVQRILLHESIYDEVREKLVAATRKLRSGDPKDPEVFIGPMISEKEAARLDDWVREAVAAGAKLVKPGQEVFWGGYSGYFADPDGHPWEVAWNPFWPIAEDGAVALPA